MKFKHLLLITMITLSGCKNNSDKFSSIFLNDNEFIYGDAKYKLNDNEISLVSVENLVHNFEIPNEIDNYPVTRIEPYSLNNYIEKLTINSNIEYIDEYAFDNCSNLSEIIVNENNHYKIIDNILYSVDGKTLLKCPSTNEKEIVIKDGTTTINPNAFNYLKFESITFPESLTTIKDRAFTSCDWLYKLHIPKNVEFIGKGLLSSYSLEKVTIDSENNYFTIINNIIYSKDLSVVIKDITKKNSSEVIIEKEAKYIDEYAFSGSSRKVVLPDGLLEIREYASISNYTEIPASVKKIYDYAFNSSDANLISIPKNVEYIGTYAFEHFKNITNFNVDEENQYYKSIDGVLYSKDGSELIKYPNKKDDETYNLPTSTKVIKENALHNNEIKNLYLNESIEIIEDTALNLDKLEKITLTRNIKSIGRNNFSTSNLKYIEVDDKNESYKDIDGVLYSKNGSELIKYPLAKTDTSYTIPKGTQSIANEAFYDCFIQNIDFPDSLTSIGEYAFYSCDNLESITLPKNLTILNASLFSNCKNLKNVTLPTNLEVIKEFAFSYCSSLKNITLPDSLTLIEKNAFSYCSSLDSIIIPNKVKIIEYEDFISCKNLSSITFGTNVSVIFNCLLFCDNLETISVKKNNSYYKSIDNVLFTKDGKRLIKYAPKKEDTNYTISRKTKYINEYAFSCDESDLESVFIPKSVEYIGRYAFSNNKNLIINCEVSEKPNGWDDKWATSYSEINCGI